MTVRKYVDHSPTTTLTGALTAGGTSATVASLTGFPSAFPYTATIALGTSTAEVVLVTAAVGTTLTITRNYDGQGAFSHSANDTFDHTAVAADFTEANAHVNASSGVHGITGSVVGTSDAQTLANKTLTTPVIASISNGGTVTIPSGTRTLVARDTTDTLTNKTLTNPTINDQTATGTVTNSAVHSGNPALVGKSTAGGKSLSLRDSAGVEQVSVTEAGVLTSSQKVQGATLATAAGTAVAVSGALWPIVYASTAARDAAIPSPNGGYIVYVTGVGLQVYSATGSTWRTIAGTA